MENQTDSHQKRAVALEELINNFAKYLKNSRGLAQPTIIDYCKYVRYFFQEQCRGGKIHLDVISSKRVIQSLLKFAQKNDASRTQHIIYALRSFFRYLKQAQLIKEDLVNVVPPVANRKKTLFRDVLSLQMLDELTKSCDRTNPLGKRNYAILLLMTTLGLRSCEVCNLKLNDIDWDKAELIVHGKGSEDCFPIFQEVGKALVDYLKYGRPNCDSKKVFIQSVHPFKEITTSCIRHIVSFALDRCNLSPNKRGAHLLRYSFATQLLDKGATLEEIGVVLRHKDIETTAIYAKAKFSSLKTIIQPWPLQVKMEDNHD